VKIETLGLEGRQAGAAGLPCFPIVDFLLSGNIGLRSI